MSTRPYLALSPNVRYYLDGENTNPPDWHRLHVALSRQPRFAGGSPIVVLQHAFAVRWLLKRRGHGATTLLLGFLHDHQEGIVGEVPDPIKKILGPVWAERIEGPAERYIRRWFDLTGADEDAVHKADKDMCYTEAVQFGIAQFGDEWLGGFDRDTFDACAPLLIGAQVPGPLALINRSDRIVQDALTPRETSP